MLARWYYVFAYFAMLTMSTIFYFVAGSVDPGFVSLGCDKAIMVAYEVNTAIYMYKDLRTTLCRRIKSEVKLSVCNTKAMSEVVIVNYGA